MLDSPPAVTQKTVLWIDIDVYSWYQVQIKNGASGYCDVFDGFDSNNVTGFDGFFGFGYVHLSKPLSIECSAYITGKALQSQRLKIKKTRYIRKDTGLRE